MFKGPEYLHQEMKDMPISRDFLLHSKDLVPTEELRAKRATLLLTVVDPQERSLCRFAEDILNKASSLDRATSVLARVMRAYICKDRELIKKPVTAKELELARKVLLAASMGPTVDAYETGKLESLKPSEHFGIILMQGRAGHSLEALLGRSHLPVLMPSTRLAELVMW